MTPHKGWNGEDIKLKLSISMDKPSNVKKSGLVFINTFYLFMSAFHNQLFSDSTASIHYLYR